MSVGIYIFPTTSRVFPQPPSVFSPHSYCGILGTSLVAIVRWPWCMMGRLLGHHTTHASLENGSKGWVALEKVLSIKA